MTYAQDVATLVLPRIEPRAWLLPRKTPIDTDAGRALTAATGRRLRPSIVLLLTLTLFASLLPQGVVGQSPDASPEPMPTAQPEPSPEPAPKPTTEPTARPELRERRPEAAPPRAAPAGATPFPFRWVAPIRGGSANNALTAGGIKTIRFSLGGDRGRDVIAPGWPTSQRYDCTTGRLIPNTQWPTRPFGANGLRYHPVSRTYAYTWQTREEWSGQCRLFRLRLTDGITHRARFTILTFRFLHPIRRFPLTNLRTAGTTVPIRFHMGSSAGRDPFFNDLQPRSARMDCATGARLGDWVSTNPPGLDGLTRNAATNDYRYAWRTRAAWAGTCRRFEMRMTEGSVEVLEFRFRRAQAPGNRVPVARNDTGAGFTTDEATPFTTGNVLANDTDPDGDPLSIANVDRTGLRGTVTNRGDGTFRYRPQGAFESLGSGEQAIDRFGYTVRDGRGGRDTARVRITVTGVNDPPSIADASRSVSEDVPNGTPLGAPLPVTDPDTTDTHTFAITGGNAAGVFAIDASTGQLRVADASGLDAATTPSYSLTVRVTDDGGPALTDTATVTVNVTATNQPPVISGGPFSIAENPANGALVGTMSVTDPDAGQAHTFAIIGGNTGGAFAIGASTGAITVADPADVDHETNPSFSLQVRVTDDGTPALSDDITVTVTVSDVNELPTGITLSNATVAENQSAGATVGSLSATDPDRPAQTITFTLVGGPGSTDNGRFQMTGNTLQMAGPLDFEAQASYSIRVRATDPGGLTFERALTITVTNVNEAPTGITLTPSTIAEDLPSGSTVGILTADDQDTGQGHTFTLMAGTGDDDNASFTINTATDQLQTAVSLTTTATLSIRVEADDGNGGTVEQQLTVTVTDANDAPSGADNTIALNEVIRAASAAPDFGFTDPADSPPNVLASVLITTLPAAGALTLNNNPVIADQEVPVGGLGQLAFTPAANATGTPYTTFTFQVRDDGGTASGGVDLDPSPNTLTFTVTPVNDPPSGTNNMIAIAEDTSHTFAAADFGFTDPDDTPQNGFASVVFTTVPAAGSLTLRGAEVTDGRQILAGALGDLVFTPAPDATGSPYASFTFQVRDDGGTANGGVDLDQSANTITITVTAVNDAPVTLAPSTVAALPAGGGAWTADVTGISISDVDAGADDILVILSVDSGTLQVRTDVPGGVGSGQILDNGSAQVTITASLAQINTTLAATNGLTYNAPTLPAIRTDNLVIITNDLAHNGSGGEQTDTDSVAITFVDIAPTVGTTTPADGATDVATDTSISVTFSEAVTAASPGSFTINCPATGLALAYSLNGSGTDTITLDPTATLPADTTCQVTVVAAGISDTDTDDPPDTMAADLVFTFTTDAAPAVLTTTPALGATGVSTATDITITFSEDVTVTDPASFTISCPAAGPDLGYALTGSGTSTVTLDPDANLPEGTVCEVTVVGAQVSDVDGNDPPDTMEADFVFSFTSDVAPTVQATTPTDGATQVGTTANVTVTFTEPVAVADDWFGITCATSGTHDSANSVVSGGPVTFTIDTTTDFTAGESCTLTVFGAQVADQDPGDPPDAMAGNHEADFTIDVAPTVQTTTPTNNATDVLPTANITVTFTEAVNAASPGSFTIDCPATGPDLGYALTGSGTTTITLDPTADLPAGTTCEVTVLAAGITDTDTGDPPDTMVADVVFTFGVRPGGVADAFAATGNIAIQVAAPGVLENDLANAASPLTVNAVQGSGANVGVAVPATGGGIVTLNANGSFTFDPPAGASSGTPTFSYTATNAATGTTVTTTVTVTVSDIVWFICDACGGLNAGTLLNPYTSISAFSNANGDGAGFPTAGQKLFIRAGTYDAADDNLVLLANQTVSGQGQSATSFFDPVGTIEHPAYTALTAGPRPVIAPTGGNAVTVANGNTITQFDIGNGSSPANAALLTGPTTGNWSLTANNMALAGNGRALDLSTAVASTVTLTATFDRLITADSTTNGVTLTRVTGTLTVNNTGGTSSITGADAASFVVNGGTVGITFPGNITHTAAGAAMVSVTDHTTGTITFSGTLNASNGTGLQFANADSTTSYIFTGSTTLNGGNAGIDITGGSAGTFSFGGTTITNPTGVALNVDGASGAITIGGAISKNTAGRLVDFNGYDTGTATISGNLSCTAQCDGIEVTNDGTASGIVTFSGTTKTLNTTADTAVNLDNNDGGAVSFTGGNLDIDTTSGGGFSATGGGTVTVQGSGNTITSTTGIALDIVNTTIGAGRLTFLSISANGAANGIVLNNTGTSGSLTVTGDGGASNNGSGGTIQNTTGAGVTLNDTDAVGLNYINITNAGTDSIRITDINGFALDRSTISDGSAANSAHQLIDIGDFASGTPVNGTIAISNSVIGPPTGSTSPDDNLAVGISSGTSTWNIANTTFRNTGNSGIDFEARGGSTATVTIDGSTFAGAGGATSGRGVYANALGTASLTTTIQGSIFTNNFIHIDLNGQSGSHTFEVLDNTLTGAEVQAINVFSGTDSTGTFTGTLDGNVVGDAGIAGSGSAIGWGIRVNINGGSDAIMLLNDNTIRQTPNGRAIEIIARNGTGGLDVTVTDNDANPQATANPLAGIFVQSNCLPTCNTVRADVRNNTVPGGASTDEGGAFLTLVETNASTLQLVNTTGSATCSQQLAAATAGNVGSTSASAGCSLISGPIGTP